MSVAPRTVISHKGSGQRHRELGIELPWAITDARPASLLKLLGAKRFRGNAEAELRKQIEQHAAALPWPAAVFAEHRSGEVPEPCSDLLTIVTVLSKIGHSVYLRDKEPNLAAIAPGRRFVLHLP